MTREGVRGIRKEMLENKVQTEQSGSLIVTCPSSGDKEWSIINLQGKLLRGTNQVGCRPWVFKIFSSCIREFPAESISWSHSETSKESYSFLH